MDARLNVTEGHIKIMAYYYAHSIFRVYETENSSEGALVFTLSNDEMAKQARTFLNKKLAPPGFGDLKRKVKKAVGVENRSQEEKIRDFFIYLVNSSWYSEPCKSVSMIFDDLQQSVCEDCNQDCGLDLSDEDCELIESKKDPLISEYFKIVQSENSNDVSSKLRDFACIREQANPEQRANMKAMRELLVPKGSKLQVPSCV